MRVRMANHSIELREWREKPAREENKEDRGFKNGERVRKIYYSDWCAQTAPYRDVREVCRLGGPHGRRLVQSP